MNDDSTLLRQYLDGSESAFRELVERNLGLVYGAALRRTLGNRHAAAEIAQQVFIAVSRKARQLQHHPALGAWLYTAARNAAHNHMTAENRRRRYESASSAANINDETTCAEWETLRPVIDGAIDSLSSEDRTAIVLRFLQGRPYAVVGHALGLSENTARMRTERALERMRAVLKAKGIASTGAALGLALSNQAVIAAPGSLAGTVAAAALAAPPVSGFTALFIMNKLSSSALVGLAAAGITGFSWNAVASNGSQQQLAALRLEHARLVSAAGTQADPANAAAIAAEFESGAMNAVRALQNRKQKAAELERARHVSSEPTGSPNTGVTASGHRNRGISTPTDAHLTFAWAADTAELETLSAMLYIDPAAKEDADAVVASMPASIRQQFPTPEGLFAFFLAAQTQLGPPPGPDVLERMDVVELIAGRVALRRPGAKPSLYDWSYQHTPAGWKVVITPALVDAIPRAAMTNDFFARVSQPTS